MSLCIAAAIGYAQGLAPRAYTITPVRANAVTVSYSFNDGAVFADPTLPIEDATGRFHVQAVSYYHSLDLLGRSSNVTVYLPYAFGNFQGIIAGQQDRIYRSGLADAGIRLAINLWGAPAMSVKEFLSWRERTLIGASLRVIAPTGQYDPAKLINPGTNRWAVKPELGFSRRWRRFALDCYGGAWLFTANPKFYPGRSLRTQRPIGVGEIHLSYYLKPRLWLSLDGNFWAGGRSTVDGAQNNDLQRNSRVGGTSSIPLNRHQSLKFSYNAGAYVSVGGDFKTFSVAWQYSWLGGTE